jgi:hypothetical protein
MGMTHSLLRLAGRDWPVPDYSMVSRRQKTLQVGTEVAPTSTGLHLVVDSAGIKMRTGRLSRRWSLPLHEIENG